MSFFGWISSSIGVAVGFWAGGESIAATNSTADFREVYDLVHAHLPGADDATLNRAALQGLLTAFRSKVQLGTNAASSGPDLAGPLVSQARVLDDSVAYVRVARVAEGLDREVASAWSHLEATNSLKGVVLDLRFCRGTDYAAAAAVADLFTAKAQPLIVLGNRTISSQEKTNVTRAPIAILVNAGTSGGAEALAAILRETGVGLILGQRTAGDAMLMESFPLKNGEQLRIASAPIHLGDGTALPSQGLEPDIPVTVSREEERAYFADPFGSRNSATAGAKDSSTNQPSTADAGSRRGYMNEAELVREHKLGQDPDEDVPDTAASPRRAEPAKPVIKDPVLARAVDLLKGLAVVRQDRP